MQLESISIVGFRSILDMRILEIKSPTLLTGHNDAGKTALLDCIRFLLNEYTISERDATYETSESTLDNYLVTDGETPITRVGETFVKGVFTRQIGTKDSPESEKIEIRRIMRNQTAPTYEILQYVPIDLVLRDYRALNVSELKSLATNYGVVTTGLLKLQLLEAIDGVKEASAKEEAWMPMPNSLLQDFPRLEFFNPSGVRDAEDSIRTTLQSAYKTYLQDDVFKGSVKQLENSLEVKLKDDAKLIEDHIINRCSDIGEVKILPTVNFKSGLDATTISVTSRAGEDVHLGEAGAGRARRVSLAVWEYNTKLLAGAGDIVILYDEPDTHLDYLHQRKFMQTVRDQCSLPNIKMVIATHSMNLIDQINIEDVVHLKHKSHRTILESIVDNTHAGLYLGKIAMSLGLKNTVLLHERIFVGVEGETELTSIPILFRNYKGQHLESFGIAIWPCGSNVGALEFAAYLASRNRSVVFLVDADSRMKEKARFSESSLRKSRLNPEEHAIYWGDPNEIEDIFTDELWIRVANSRWNRNDGRDWTVGDISVFRSGKFSDEILRVFKTESDSGPQNKSEMLLELSMSLESDEIPQSIKDIFDDLVQRANQN